VQKIKKNQKKTMWSLLKAVVIYFQY
jgi:hypothetical protein